MKSIPLTQGKFALVDDEDYEWLMIYEWDYTNGYAKRYGRVGKTNKPIAMHEQIMKPPAGMIVDHKDSNKLNNQKKNLRICTQRQNSFNREKAINNTSGYIGVSKRFLKGNGQVRWASHVTVSGIYIHLGVYSTPEEAARVRDGAAREYFGEFAKLNFPEENT